MRCLKHMGPSFVLLAWLGAVAYAAIQLNRLYYAHGGAFFDSASYYYGLAEMAHTVRTEGLGAALRQAVLLSTVALPLIQGALLAVFLPASRAMGTLIQVIWLAAFCFSLYFYLVRYRRMPPALAVPLAGSPTALQCLYFYNGGLSDYRMDLIPALLYGLVVVWYLATLETDRLYPWLLTGLSIGLACLSRATAPVLISAALVPPLVWRLAAAPSRQRRLDVAKGILGMAGVAALVCLWFYVLRFGDLYHYYAVWNVDAQARLPWRESQKHLLFALRHIGLFAAGFVVVWHLAAVWACRRRGTPVGARFRPDFALLYMGLAPAGVLALAGAGLNPYVAMPAAVGTFLFLLLPSQAIRDGLPHRAAALVGAAAFLSCFLAATKGISSHMPRPGAVSLRRAHTEILETILQDAAQRGRQEARFDIAHGGATHRLGLLNHLYYDLGPDQDFLGSGRTLHGIRLDLRPTGVFGAGAPAEWNLVPGATAPEKIHFTVAEATRELDYLVIPEGDAVLAKLQSHPKAPLVNRHLGELRQALLDAGSWQPLGPLVPCAPAEQVRVLVNTHRNPPTQD